MFHNEELHAESLWYQRMLTVLSCPKILTAICYQVILTVFYYQEMLTAFIIWEYWLIAFHYLEMLTFNYHGHLTALITMQC